MAEQFDRLLSQKEVAAWLGCSESLLEMNRFKKTGIQYCKIGRRCVYKTSDVQKYIDDHMVGTGI